MKKIDEIIAAFECGDMGEVEFFELALEAGMDMKEIGYIMQMRACEEYMEENGA